MLPGVCAQDQMKTPEFVNVTVVQVVAEEVHETETAGDGTVEEELLYNFFLLKLWFAVTVALSGRSPISIRN